MASVLVGVPALVALVVAALLVAVRLDDSVRKRFRAVSRAAFDRFVPEEHVERQRLLQAAYVPDTYRAYAVTTYSYALLLGVLGGIVGGYAVAGLVLALPTIGDFLAGLPNTINAVLGYPATWELDLPPPVFYGLAVASGVVAAAFTGIATLSLRWRLLEGRAEARRRRINESTARTVAFLFALSRGGMPFPNAMRTLADNTSVYGETAREVSVAVREMDLFGTDVINAIRRMSERTPSEDFKTFGENLASVLQSGQDLPQFLNDQYERYHEEARERQEEVLELLATLAEAYVTVFVAGTLFLITVLLVFGLTTTDTLWIIQLLGYVAIPLGNIAFMVFLNQRLELLGIGSGSGTSVPDGDSLASGTERSPESVRAADGGRTPALTANFERLAVYDRLSGYQRILRRPYRVVLDNPTALLSLTVPIALLAAALRFPSALTGSGFNVRVGDDIVIQSALFVLGSYAVVRYLHKRRLQRIETATPEFLERLASLNEAGMSVVESFDRVRGSDLGALSTEVERIWADVSLGANVEAALVRFGHRVRTTPVTRAVTLLTNAMRASSSIGQVLRIAATQARADLRMKRQRRRQMLTYLVVIYVSFAVFLVIIVAVDEVLVPSLPDSVPDVPTDSRLGVNAEQFTRLGGVNKAAYTLVFFHTALIQAVLSGLIGGQIGEGTIRDGVKHAAVMLGIAYVVFLLLSSPVASIEMGQQSATDKVTIESAELSEGGFIVIHAYSSEGEVLGRTGYLPAGTSKDVTVELDEDLGEGATVFAVPHRDTDDDREFEYDGGEVDRLYPPNRAAVSAQATLRDGVPEFDFE